MGSLGNDLLAALDTLFQGPYAGYRATHAKGIVLTGTFTPAPGASSLTKAPHLKPTSTTQVRVRFSDFSGVPTIPDFAQAPAVPYAGPRGCAILFMSYAADIIGHSIDSFPTRTPEEFLQLLTALKAGLTSDELAQFFESHPKALAFQGAKNPIPSSFAREQFFSVSAYKFTNSDNVSCYGRYRVLPDEGTEYLTPADLAKQSPNFLFDEIRQRVGKEPVKFQIVVQVAEDGDPTDDATARWPETRKLISFGEISITEVAPDNDKLQQAIMFSPIPTIPGIEASDDPLFKARADVYGRSAQRRMEAGVPPAKPAS